MYVQIKNLNGHQRNVQGYWIIVFSRRPHVLSTFHCARKQLIRVLYCNVIGELMLRICSVFLQAEMEIYSWFLYLEWLEHANRSGRSFYTAFRVISKLPKVVRRYWLLFNVQARSARFIKRNCEFNLSFQFPLVIHSYIYSVGWAIFDKKIISEMEPLDFSNLNGAFW